MKKGLSIRHIGDMVSLASIKSELIKKYPNLQSQIEEASLRIEPKYLTWFVRELNKSPDNYTMVELYDYIQEFKNFQNLLTQKDIYKYTIESLKQEVAKLKELRFTAVQLAEQYIQILKDNKEKYSKTYSREEARDMAYKESREWLDKIEPATLQSMVRKQIRNKYKEKYYKTEQKPEEKSLKQRAYDNSDIIYEDDRFLVVLPGTTQASQYFGQGTQWCTAASEYNYFNSYSSRGIYLYYIIDKKNQDSNNPMRKIAFAMTKENDVVRIEDIFNALDVRIKDDRVKEYMDREEKFFSKIINVINQDISKRKKTKYTEIFETMSPEELEISLSNIQNEENLISYLIEVFHSTAVEETRKLAIKYFRPIAKKWIEVGNNFAFLHYRLYEMPEFQDLTRIIAEKLAQNGNTKFFGYGFDKIPEFQDLTRIIAEKWAQTGSDWFCRYGLHKRPEFQDLAIIIAERWYSEGYKIHLIPEFQDLARFIAEKWAREGNSYFFHHELHLIPEFQEIWDKYNKTAYHNLSKVKKGLSIRHNWFIGYRTKRASSGITKKDLEKIYELEYKRHKSSEQGKMWQTNAIEKQIEPVLQKGLYALVKAFEIWLSNYDRQFQSDIKSTIEIYKENSDYEDMPEELLRDILRQKHYDNPVHIRIRRLYDTLKSAPTGNLDTDLTLFNTGLHNMHHTGNMVEYLPGVEESGIDNQLLSELTSGDKYIEKWNREIGVRESVNIFVSRFIKNASELSAYEDTMQQEMSKWRRVSRSLNEQYQSALANYILNYVALNAVQVIGSGVKSGAVRNIPLAVRDYFSKEFPKHIDGLYNQNKQMSADIVRSGIGELEKDVVNVLNSLTKKSSLKLSKLAQTPQIELSETENKIFDLLKEVIQTNDLGSTIRASGGWIRDKLIGNQSKDIDIVIDNMSGKEFAQKVVKYAQSKNLPVKSVGVIEARPEQSKHLETAVVNLFGQDIDFVQARAERYDPGSRIPKVVPGSAVEDAYRRDFTINSMFYNINSGEIEDPTGMGLSDLESGIIRTPSPPKELWSQLGIEGEENAITPKKTFMDDPLRVLRAIRFASRYGFDLAPELKEAAKDEEVQDAFAKKISRERMEIELRKMLTGKDPVGAMELVKELGLRSEVLRLPEEYEEWEMDQQSPYHQLNVWEHTMETLGNLQEIIKDRNLDDKEKFVVNLAALLHDAGKLNPEIKGVKDVGGKIHHTYHGHEDVSIEVAEHLLRNLPGVRVEEIEKVKNLIDGARRVNPQRQLNDEACNLSRKALGKFIQKIGDDWESAVDLAMADTSAHKKDWLPTFDPTYYKTMKEQVGSMGLEKAHELRPALSGNEIMALVGRKGGPWLGQLNQALVDWQLENPNATMEQAKSKVLELYENMGLDKVSVISVRHKKIAETEGFFEEYYRGEVERAANESPITFFGNNYHKKPKYNDLAQIAIENLIRDRPVAFFVLELDKDPQFSNLARSAAESIIQKPYFLEFFKRGLHKDPRFEDLAQIAAKRILETRLSDYFYYNLHKDEKFNDLTRIVAEKSIETNPSDYFFYYLYNHPSAKDLEQIAAEKLIVKDFDSFLVYRLDKKFPDIYIKYKRDIIAKQKQFDEENPETDERPFKAKELAEEMYQNGYRTFFHTGSQASLDGVGGIAGEVCVSSWDLSTKAFTGSETTLIALFEGKCSHFFNRDVWSDINDLGLRELTNKTKEESGDNIFEQDGQHDEGWFNPSMPGNKLVGYGILGDPSSLFYDHEKDRAIRLAEKNNTNFLELHGDVWQLSTIREKPEMKMEEYTHPMVEKYKHLPEMREYSFISKRHMEKFSIKPISKRAEEFYDISAKKLITANDLIKLYELEYKLSQLYQRDLSKPSSIKKISIMENQLFKSLSKAINAMAEIYKWWIELHKHDFSVASMEQMEEEIHAQYPERSDILLDQLIDWYSGYRTRYDDIFNNISNNIKQKAFGGGLFGGIVDVYKKLQAGVSGNINNDMVLFHTALNTVHQAGPMLTHLIGSTDITEELLNDLSAGKFVPQWDEEISKVSAYIPISKRAKKQHAGIFMPLPEKLAKQFPLLGKHDSSVPHVTVLYIGDVDKKHYQILETIVKGVISDFPPFKLEIDDKVSYFNNSSEKVAKLKVISKEIHKLNKQLKQMISDAGIEIDNTYPNYSPHVTLEYMEPSKEKYDGEIPEGSWISHSVEIWGCGNPKEMLFDKRLSKNKKEDGKEN